MSVSQDARSYLTSKKEVCGLTRFGSQQIPGNAKNGDPTSSHKGVPNLEGRGAQLLHSLDGTKSHPFVTAGMT